MCVCSGNKISKSPNFLNNRDMLMLEKRNWSLWCVHCIVLIKNNLMHKCFTDVPGYQKQRIFFCYAYAVTSKIRYFCSCHDTLYYVKRDQFTSYITCLYPWKVMPNTFSDAFLEIPHPYEGEKFAVNWCTGSNIHTTHKLRCLLYYEWTF